MRQFNNVLDGIKYAGKWLLKNGVELPVGKWQGINLSEKEKMRVCLNYSFICNTPNLKEGLEILTQADMPWAENHFKERVQGFASNPGETYKQWPYLSKEDLERYHTDSTKFTHTYMERYWPQNDSYGGLDDLLDLLNLEPHTRQAYFPVWFPEDTGVKHGGRVPCTLGYLFMPVGDFLHCNYYIRSCDLYRHFRNDVYLTMRLMQWICEKLGNRWQPGILTMHIANFHYFDNDLHLIKKDKRWDIE